jgi:hypothetical protein
MFAGAQVYRWVDEQGRVHFGDRPPEKEQAEQLSIEPGPTEQEILEAREKLQERLEARRQSDLLRDEATAQQTQETTARSEAEKLRFESCVSARQQLGILQLQARVFKLDDDWERTYLPDERRPAEIARLQGLVETNCEDDPKSVREQRRQVILLGRALNIRCVNAREKFAVAVDEAERAKYGEYLETDCPDVDVRGPWIADYVFVRK